MAFWIFKCNPMTYKLNERLNDPNPTISWTVTRFRDQIATGDIVFLLVTGDDRRIRAVIRVDQKPQDIPELDSEQKYWSNRDSTVCSRIFGTLTNRDVNLSADFLKTVPGLGQLSIFHGFQQATNFPVTQSEAELILSLIEDLAPGVGDSRDGQDESFVVVEGGFRRSILRQIKERMGQQAFRNVLRARFMQFRHADVGPQHRRNIGGTSAYVHDHRTSFIRE